MAATQDEVPAGNVAKLVNRLSKDLSKESMAFRKSTLVSLTKLATVRYSYHAAQDDELNLKVDDVIEVIEDAESGWMKGKLRSTGQVGLFPTNFVQFSEGQQLSKNGICKADLKKKASEHTSDNSPEALQRPALTDNQKKRAAPIFNSSVGKKGDEGDGDTSATKEMARVLYPYTPNHDDELALKEVGTMITVVKKTCSDPGWFLGEIDGKRGLIPDNFVEFIKVPATSSEEKKTSAPAMSVPNVPAKPAKPAGLISVANATKHLSVVSSAGKPPSSTPPTGNVPRGGSRVLDTAFANTLAEALNKQQKQFGLKPVVKYEEGPADTRVDGPLEHITTSRPKQPNKRPPSTIFNKRKSNDVMLDSSITESSEADSTSFSKKTGASTSVLSQPTLFNLPPTVPSQTATSNKVEKGGDNEYVSYAEFKRLFDRFQEFQKEVQSKVAQLEAKIALMK